MSATSPGVPITPAVPEHVAVIMDGNGRWAGRRALPRHAGHKAGVKAARATVEACAESGVKCLTLFAFSSENWRRPREEVGALMALFVEVLKRETEELHRNNIRLRFLGDRPSLGQRLGRRIAAAEALTADNTGLDLNVAMAYGGRWDIVEAARRAAERVAAGELSPADISEETIRGHLALGDCPDPDLLIRTGGEHRISNFLLWNLAYAEVFFTPTLWPDFSSADIDAAFSFYRERQRRFGRTAEQLEARSC